jgi:hypothetical protein
MDYSTSRATLESAVTKLAYIYVLGSVIFAFWFHAHEESQRAAAIDKATKAALFYGVKVGCDENNTIRDQVWLTAVALGAQETEEVRANLMQQDCVKDAKRIVTIFQRSTP